MKTYSVKCGDLDTVCQGVTAMQAAMIALRFVNADNEPFVSLSQFITVTGEDEEPWEFSLETIVEMLQLAYNPTSEAVFEVDRPV